MAVSPERGCGVSVDQLREALQWVPFLGLINKQKVDGSMLQHPLTIRLAEAAIIGLVVMYGASQKVELKLTHLEGEIMKLRAESAEIRQQLRLAEQELWRRKGLDKLRYAGGAPWTR